MTLQLLHSEFLCIGGKLDFLFYQRTCTRLHTTKVRRKIIEWNPVSFILISSYPFPFPLRWHSPPPTTLSLSSLCVAGRAVGGQGAKSYDRKSAWYSPFIFIPCMQIAEVLDVVKVVCKDLYPKVVLRDFFSDSFMKNMAYSYRSQKEFYFYVLKYFSCHILFFYIGTSMFNTPPSPPERWGCNIYGNFLL